MRPVTSIRMRDCTRNRSEHFVRRGNRGRQRSGCSDCISTTEFPDGVIEPAILALADRTDLIVLDCSYTTDELALHTGWSHVSWKQGVRLANVANAKRLCLFHHDRDRDDVFMDAVAEAVEAARPGTTVSAEGMSIDL
jgi:phosphoribosyl 1,2-cyclic phosphodiesterase